MPDFGATADGSGLPQIDRRGNVGRRHALYALRDTGQQFLLWVPPGADDGAARPLIVYLHGAHARGDDASKILTCGEGTLPRLLDDGQFDACNAIVLSPLLAGGYGSEWARSAAQAESVVRVIDAALCASLRPRPPQGSEGAQGRPDEAQPDEAQGISAAVPGLATALPARLSKADGLDVAPPPPHLDAAQAWRARTRRDNADCARYAAHSPGDAAEPTRTDASDADVFLPQVDLNRIYCTGPSCGGLGCYTIAARLAAKSAPGICGAPQANRRTLPPFAAIAPICGGGAAVFAGLLAATPSWFWHSASDSCVDVSETDAIVSALRLAGAPVRYTRLTAAETPPMPSYCEWMTGHNAWQPAYHCDSPLWPWLFDQRLGSHQLVTKPVPLPCGRAPPRLLPKAIYDDDDDSDVDEQSKDDAHELVSRATADQPQMDQETEGDTYEWQNSDL